MRPWANKRNYPGLVFQILRLDIKLFENGMESPDR
jgi:hypothetical protein